MAEKEEEKFELDSESITQEVSRGLIIDILEERKSERRWTFIRRAVFAVAMVGAVGVYLAFMAGWWGYRAIPWNDSVAVVPINGVIAKDTEASANAVIHVLDKLFASEKVKGIVLNIDSGGGSPTEAERIADYIVRMKEETGKPVIAVCGTMCASAAYLIAIHSDEVVLGEYSWAGSIGAILKGWDFEHVVEKLEIDQRVFASGPMKDLMNPFKSMPDQMAEKMAGLVEQTADRFIEEVKERRGDKLDLSQNLFTGEVWVGSDCVALGLVDRVGTLEGVIADHFGDMPYAFYSPKRKENSFFNAILSQVGTSIGDRLLQEMQYRVEM